VIVPAEKFPEGSLATMALAVFAFVAVVALLLTFPAVAIVANFVSTIPALELMSALTIVSAEIVVAFPDEVTSPVKLAFTVADMPVRPEPSPTNFVEVKTPVDGTKLSFVEVTFAGKFPVFAITQRGYTEVSVAMSYGAEKNSPFLLRIIPSFFSHTAMSKK
jgi:hypothetical protein